jgi:Glycosyl transferases group 1
MLIDYLASRDDVRRVLVFDAPTSEFDLLKRLDNAAGVTQDRLIYQKTYEKVFGKLDRDKLRFNVFVYPPGVYGAAADGSGRTPLIDGYAAYLSDVFEREGVQPQRAVFWLYPKNFLAPALVERFSPARVVVDVVDDHRAWPGVSAQERERLTENYRQTLALADVAFTNCEPVRDAMREFCPQVRLVPNGCDAAPSQEAPVGNAYYDAFVKAPGKVIGFVGNLEQKIDIDLIDRVAERFADCQVVLIGSTHANPQVLKLKRHANVRMPGVVPYAKIGAWLARFDVGIIPHLNSEMTQSMNPLKLYVYLSHRVPVVSTEVFNIDRSTSFVHVARSHDEFIERLGAVLAAGPLGGDARQALDRYVGANCWAARFEKHVDEIVAGVEEKSDERQRLRA